MLPVKENLSFRGRVEMFQTRGVPKKILGEEIKTSLPPEFAQRLPKRYKSCELDFSDCELLDTYDRHNILLSLGKDKLIESLSTGFVNQIARMAVGDRGALPSDPTVPKVAQADQSGLFNEVFRDDVDVTTLNIGITPGIHEVKFIKTFSATVIPITSFSNQANPVLNEVGLVMADLFGGSPLPRNPVASPNLPETDESIFSLRTFKSVPFEAANEISITFRYTIYIEG